VLVTFNIHHSDWKKINHDNVPYKDSYLGNYSLKILTNYEIFPNGKR